MREAVERAAEAASKEPKVPVGELAQRALDVAGELASSMPDTMAANRLRVWLGDPDPRDPGDEAQRAQVQSESLARVANGQEDSWWLRRDATRGAGNAAGLAAFGQASFQLWREAPSLAAARRLVEICADAAWRACAARFYAREGWLASEQALDRFAGLALESRSVFEPRLSLLGLKKSLVAAMAEPWLRDHEALGMEIGEMRSQGDAFRKACVEGASGLYRAKPVFGAERLPEDNPLRSWREDGYDAEALGARLALWRQERPPGSESVPRLSQRF